MRVDFGKDGCAIVVVAETDSDRVALSAWLRHQTASETTGRGTETDPQVSVGSCKFVTIAEQKYGDPVGPGRVVFG